MTLHGTQATVTSDHGTKMVVAHTAKGKLTFYPHSEPVTMTKEEAIEMIINLCRESNTKK